MPQSFPAGPDLLAWLSLPAPAPSLIKAVCFARLRTRSQATTMSGDGGPRAPAAAQRPFSISLLPPDCLERIATLGFLTQVSPFWDRGDLLQQAASLACVGNRGCSDLARLLFGGLSPRLGEYCALPKGMRKRMNTSVDSKRFSGLSAVQVRSCLAG